MRKGMELPVSTVVVVAAAVLVLVVVSSFFLSGSGKQFSEIDARSRFGQECTRLKCTVSEAQSLQATHPDLYKYCRAVYGDVSAAQCVNACGCRIDYSSKGEVAQDVNQDIAELIIDLTA
ncbi:MAG: hypothetical protein HYW26_01025 [Candidatus Aenigmarchaeota archaeon]|nr:hypothetical protein [Candidatus Aenigmarchaeota archaeon]